jgi:hypothetical protein
MFGNRRESQYRTQKKEEKLKKESARRLKLIMNTELSAKNKMQTTGSLPLPVLRHCFGIINWHREEIRKLDRKTREIFTVYGQHHPRVDTDGLYVPTKGAEGLTQIQVAYITETTKLVEYIVGFEDPLLQVVRTHQRNANASLPHTEHKCETNTNEKWEKDARTVSVHSRRYAGGQGTDLPVVGIWKY